RLHEEARKAAARRDRRRLLGALSGFRDPALVGKAMSLVLTDEFDVRESLGLLFGGLEDPRNRRMVYDFVKTNYEAMLAKMPRESGRSLMNAVVAQCDASMAPDAEAFSTDRICSP